MSEGNQQLGFKGSIPPLCGFPHQRKAHLERSSRLKNFPKKACGGEAAIVCRESHRDELLSLCKNAPGTTYRDSTDQHENTSPYDAPLRVRRRIEQKKPKDLKTAKNLDTIDASAYARRACGGRYFFDRNMGELHHDIASHDFQYPWSGPASGWPERLGTSCPTHPLPH